MDIFSVSLQDTIQNWHLPAYRVHSKLSQGEGEGTIIYFGNKPQYASWIHQLYGHAAEPALLGYFSLAQILRGNNPAIHADIALFPVNPLTVRVIESRTHVIPLFVDCIIDLGKPISELITSKGANHPMRTARHFAYHFEIIRDDKLLHEFFEQMLLPTVLHRHEERAFISQWEDIQNAYRNGTLIAAYLDNQWIGAVLLTMETADLIRIANLGWRDGDDLWLKKGIVPALYNKSLTWAQEKGFKRFNLGASNPFVKDGPLNFKLKWGATMALPELRIVGNEINGVRSFIGARFDLTSPAAQFFLASSPILERAGSKLRAISWNAEIPPQFHRQVRSGCEWINLAGSNAANLPA